MKILKSLTYFIILISISITLLTVVIKKSLPEETVDKIISYAQVKYEMPEELEEFKDTIEYQELEKEINNINEFLNEPKTKIVVKSLEFISTPNIVSKLITILIIVLVLSIFIIQNIPSILINASISSLITGGFMMIVPSVLSSNVKVEIITNLFNNFTKYGFIIIIISLIILIPSIIMSKNNK